MNASITPRPTPPMHMATTDIAYNQVALFSTAREAPTASTTSAEPTTPAEPAISLEGPFLDVAYTYDGSIEGLLTAIFQAYRHHEDPSDVCPEGLFQPRLGQYVRTIETDFALAARVTRGIISTCDADTFNFIKRAALCDDYEAGTDVYRFVRFAMKTGPRAMDNLVHPLVSPLAKRNKFISNEVERLRQFVRFRELEGGLFLATISPKAKVVPLIMDGFTARFNTQPFIIYDESHGMAGVYEGPHNQGKSTSVWGNCSWYLVPVNHQKDLNIPPETTYEGIMQDAWKQFYRATTIAARYNPELRQHFMPRRFWGNLTELQEDYAPRSQALSRTAETTTPSTRLAGQTQG